MFKLIVESVHERKIKGLHTIMARSSILIGFSSFAKSILLKWNSYVQIHYNKILQQIKDLTSHRDL